MPRAPELPRPASDLAPVNDAGFLNARARADEALGRISPEQVGQPVVRGAHEIRVGTASWTDPTITKGQLFYPRGTTSPEDRLRFYATQFSLVEVDSSYYSLPTRANAERWAARTPVDFIFHVKAHALMTGQPAEVARLPRSLFDALPSRLATRARIYARDLPPELHDAVWEQFMDALEPIRAAGKLGAILLQYPRWFLPTVENRAQLVDSAERLSGIAGAVELRNRHWFDGATGDGQGTDWTLAMLREMSLTHVMVDGPKGSESSVPAVPAVTTPSLAMIRLHGRRAATWEAPNVVTVERYRYLYSEAELDALVPEIDIISAQARRTTVLFNNCYGNYGTTNARELLARLV